MLTDQDKNKLAARGMSENDIQAQLECFRRGFPFLDVKAAASLDKGIMSYNEKETAEYLDAWGAYLSLKKKIVKFVPASGAASRMFKALFEFLSASYLEPTTAFEKEFFDNLPKFAFYELLNTKCEYNFKKGIEELVNENKYKEIVSTLLLKDGLNYGELPKGLLEFHSYSGGKTRTPLEEHLQEGFLYACNSKNEVNIHFTVSPEHRDMFEELADERRREFGRKNKVEYNVSFSEQKTSTDTLAVDMDNNPIRDHNGDLVFRPGGHGALIENLNDIDADVVFVKNIDNVSPDGNKAEEVVSKKLLAGVLVSVQKKIFEYLKLIDSTKYSHDNLIEMLHFIQNVLNVRNLETKLLEDAELVLYVKRKLDRPCRVCGMVKNVGEPGGGPFLVVSNDGTIAPQILESSQLDLSNPEVKQMFEQGTHFNPVDIVCGIKDYGGRHFNLKDFVDKNAGFISEKSKDGIELKALELPGLWNGAMSDWNTIFVEVPMSTFNPVKTVNDLLRKEHQA